MGTPWAVLNAAVMDARLAQVQQLAPAAKDQLCARADAGLQQAMDTAAASTTMAKLVNTGQWLLATGQAAADYLNGALLADTAQKVANSQAAWLQQGQWWTFAWQTLGSGNWTAIGLLGASAADHLLDTPLNGGAGRPEDKFAKLDSSATFGFAGDQGYYNNLVGQMFTGGPSSWWQAVQNWWNLPADPSYSNGLQFFLGEKLVRPALGDNFITGHSDWQVVGALYVASNEATLEWGCSLAVDMSNRLAESIGALLSRGGYIAYLTGDGNFSAAADQSAAFGLGVLAESDVVNLVVLANPLAPVYQGLVAARAWVSGAEQPFGGKNPLQYYAGVLADEIDPEAAADGRRAAFAFDFAVQLAIDIAIEVATAGTATPALVAEEAAVEGAAAARVAARGGKAVVEAIEQVPEARTAIQQTLKQGGKVAEEIAAAEGQAAQTGFKVLRNAAAELPPGTGSQLYQGGRWISPTTAQDLYDAGQAYTAMLRRFQADGGLLDVQPGRISYSQSGNVFNGRYLFGENATPTIQIRMGATFGTRMEELVHHLQVQELLDQGYSIRQIVAQRHVLELQARRIVEAYGFRRVH